MDGQHKVHRKNPLGRRYIRELKSEFGKYLVIFLLITATIAIVSGCVVAQGSMADAYFAGFAKFHIEDGHFETENELTKAQEKRIRDLGIRVYDNRYTDQPLSDGAKLRLFRMRSEVNLADVMEGAFPEKPDEIGLDRMFAANNGIRIGDTITVGESTYTVSGMVALSDYSTMFENNNDTMFDALQFGVALVTEEGFPENEEEWNWCYAWKYKERLPEGMTEADRAEELRKALRDEVALRDFVPRAENQAITFTGEDITGDQVMMETLLYIVIVIMAFVFAVTISSTITKEAAVIGTLRAMGYTRAELIRHYMTLPFVVTLVSGVVGNVLGYTALKKFAAGLYYNSYSLPTYVTHWNGEAFFKTTIIPVILMTAINFLMIRTKLQLTPLQFLRRELKRDRAKGTVRLSRKIPFFTRFRLRVIFQNLGNYAVLFLGIFFANFLLFFGMLLPTALQDYEEKVTGMMFCKYTYILSIPADALDEEHRMESMLHLLDFFSEVETENPDAEKFSAYVLETSGEGNFRKEEVTLYGVQENSRYLDMTMKEGDVFISSACADKYGLGAGDTITLYEEDDGSAYSFAVTGVYDYEASVSLFMPQKDLNQRFELGEETFSGYFSDTPITDISKKYIRTTIDLTALTRITRQLMHSMGGMMKLVNVFAVLMFVILVYLLSKIIIEKNAQPISMTKILGYRGGEIGALYIVPTSILVVAFILISFILADRLMEFLFRYMIGQMMTGWIFYRVNPEIWIRMFLLGAATYAVVALLEYIRILRIPKGEALKNAE